MTCSSYLYRYIFLITSSPSSSVCVSLLSRLSKKHGGASLRACVCVCARVYAPCRKRQAENIGFRSQMGEEDFTCAPVYTGSAANSMWPELLSEGKAMWAWQPLTPILAPMFTMGADTAPMFPHRTKLKLSYLQNALQKMPNKPQMGLSLC
jgi:hypothetical protein